MKKGAIVLCDQERKYLEFFQNILHKNHKFNSVYFGIKGYLTYSTITVSLPDTNYRQNKSDMLFARIKTNARVPYISFKIRYIDWFKNNNIPYFQISSEKDFFRIELKYFEPILKSPEKYDMNKLVEDMFFNAINFEKFGCCYKYKECSDAKKCLHEDLLYSTGCLYRKNLENGKIFYGENKNV